MKIDLQRGVVPISKAASGLAALIKRARAEGMPIVVTQKGRPTAVILDVDAYVRLTEAAQAAEMPASEEDQGDA